MPQTKRNKNIYKRKEKEKKVSDRADKKATKLWRDCLENIRKKVSPANYRTWWERTTGYSLEDDLLIVTAPNKLTAEYISKNQMSIVRQALQEIRGSPIEVEFVVVSNGEIVK